MKNRIALAADVASPPSPLCPFPSQSPKAWLSLLPPTPDLSGFPKYDGLLFVSSLFSPLLVPRLALRLKSRSDGAVCAAANLERGGDPLCDILSGWKVGG
eukprot:GHVT01096304.1.p4 GENE.GHVT01096304.1~~GHVT01096304.1.p4  ORF type:complete len:100 (+),score=13.82 GHVT01096304.1:831-1130(+)